MQTQEPAPASKQEPEGKGILRKSSKEGVGSRTTAPLATHVLLFVVE